MAMKPRAMKKKPMAMKRGGAAKKMMRGGGMMAMKKKPMAMKRGGKAKYLPSAAIKSLSPSEYAATTRAKRKGKAAGKQHVAQPKKIAKKTKRFRSVVT